MKPNNAVKFFLCFFLLCVFLPRVNAETERTDSARAGDAQNDNISLTLVFHELGWNALHSLTYNYGLNFAGAGAGTWAFIETGLDWKWRNLAYNNERLARAGLPVLFAGYVVPAVTPVSLYIAGRFLSDRKMQTAAAALTQALLLSQITQISIKMITERTVPGVISGVFFEPGHTRDTRTEDFSGEFNWFTFNFYDGWPSGHVLSAFSAAAALAEIYDDKPVLKIGVYTWAVLMGVGVAVNTHWASDSFAGALMGYAIGKSVGMSFNRLLKNEASAGGIFPYAAANTIGVVIRF